MARFIFRLAIVLALSLGLLLFITDRGMKPMGESETAFRYGLLRLQDAPPAVVVQKVMGDAPPQWAMRLALVWDRANVPGFWWLPLVLALAIWLVGRSVRRRGGA